MLQLVYKNGNRKEVAVQHRCHFIAQGEHQPAQAAFGLGQAVLATLMRIARSAGDEREAAARQADNVTIADIDRIKP